MSRAAPLHVALLSPAWPLGYPNGIVTYVHGLRHGLQQGGHRVSVLAQEGAAEAAADGVHPVRPGWHRRVQRVAHRLTGHPADWTEAAARAIADSVLRLHRRAPVDVLEMEESFGLFEHVQRHLPMPVVVKLHGPAFLSLVEEERSTSGGVEKIHTEREALRMARHVTSPCHDTLQRTRADCGLPDAWGRVIPNPIRFDETVPLWNPEHADPDTLLFVGRFDKRKGGDLAVRAFRRLLCERPTLRLLFVGPDHGIRLGDGGSVGLQAFVERELPPDLRSRVVILGRRSPQEIVRLRCESAMVLVCSRWDNQPGTALEALMQACPVVAFDTGGMAEVVRHDAFGRLARGGDVADFAAQVAWMLDHPREARAMGVAGRAHVRQMHDIARVADTTAHYYRQVVDEASHA